MRTTLVQNPELGEQFLSDLKSGAIPRTAGTTVFITRSTQRVSKLIIDHARFVGTLSQNAIALNIVFEHVPRVHGPKCTLVEPIGEGLWRVTARFGFVEIPDLSGALSDAQGLDPAIDLAQAKFIGTRDLVVGRRDNPALKGWRLALFAFLYRNSVKIVDRFNLPPEKVVEIAHQIEI